MSFSQLLCRLARHRASPNGPPSTLHTFDFDEISSPCRLIHLHAAPYADTSAINTPLNTQASTQPSHRPQSSLQFTSNESLCLAYTQNTKHKADVSVNWLVCFWSFSMKLSLCTVWVFVLQTEKELKLISLRENWCQCKANKRFEWVGRK